MQNYKVKSFILGLNSDFSKALWYRNKITFEGSVMYDKDQFVSHENSECTFIETDVLDVFARGHNCVFALEVLYILL